MQQPLKLPSLECKNLRDEIKKLIRFFFKQPHPGYTFEDYYQLGYEGFAEAMTRFNPKFGVKPMSFARHRVIGRILDETRNAAFTHGHLRYVTGKVIEDKLNLRNPYRLFNIYNLQKDLHEAIAQSLTLQEAQVIREYYWQDANFWEIGKRMGVTEGRICQLHKLAISKLKEWYEGQES